VGLPWPCSSPSRSEMTECAWPVEGLNRCVGSGEWDDAEDVFRVLRRVALSCDEDELKEHAVHAELTLAFLLHLCEQHEVYRKQVLECLSVLMDVDAWESTYAAQPALQAKVAELPDDIRAAFAMQHKAIEQSLLKSFSADAMLKMRAQKVSEDLQPDQVQQSVAEYREAEKLRKDMMEASAGDIRRVAFVDPDSVPERAARAAPGSSTLRAAADELQEAISTVMDIDSRAKLENAGVHAFAELRRSCLHSVSWPDVLERHAEHAPAVFNFLVDFTKRNRMRLRQICEVVNLLMASPGWAEAFHASPMLADRLRGELDDNVQAVFGMQHEKLMALVTSGARQKAEQGASPSSLLQDASLPDDPPGLAKAADTEQAPKSPEAAAGGNEAPVAVGSDSGEGSAAETASREASEIQEGQEVADQMRSMRKGLQVRFSASIRERFIGSQQCGLTTQERAAQAVTTFAKGASQALSAAEWRQATTPDGKAYYYNMTTRESRWDRPREVPMPTASANGFSVGSKVEVFSNSMQVWCSAVVEKLTEDTVTAVFQLPDADPKDWVRKDLPIGHQDLRKVEEETEPALTPVEEAEYDKHFQGMLRDGNVDTHLIIKFLGSSNLPRSVLKEIWYVANPEMKPSLGRNEFLLCCRLCGHCQAMVGDEKEALLRKAGQPLRELLQRHCVGWPAPKLPIFDAALR